MKDKMIDEGEYTQGVKAPSTRAVIVVDRGWIFAGDVSQNVAKQSCKLQEHPDPHSRTFYDEPIQHVGKTPGEYIVLPCKSFVRPYLGRTMP